MTTHNLLHDTTAWLCLAAATLPSLGCNPHQGDSTGMCDDRLPASARLDTEVIRLAAVRDLGNGVHVFPNSPDFPETLADWRGKHAELRIVSVTPGPDITAGVFDQTDSRSNSFVVVTEPIGDRLLERQ